MTNVFPTQVGVILSLVIFSSLFFFVFPTQVGVIPYGRSDDTDSQGIPHASEGDPVLAQNDKLLPEYSPRKWG